MSENDSMPGTLPFPQDFYWGCGTSPTQVEGWTVNEWAGFRARDGHTPDDGPRHWRRFEFDFACLAEMNLNAYRIGFDWGRLQPEPGAPLDRDTALHYMEMLADLRMRGVTPFLTLFHFACPKWLAARGGWAAADAPGLFADFAARVAEMVDGEVLHWITINEPVVHAFMAYVMREFPPQKRLRFDLAFRALCNMARGHALAWRAIKERLPAAEVGITKHCKHFAPLRAWHPIDRICAFAADRFFDRWGLGLFLQHGGEPVSTFLGVNYYGRMRFRGLNALSPLTGFDPEVLELHGAACDDMWEQDPAGLADCLAELSGRIELPLYVTENGVATRDEDLREQYMVDHLRACHEAIRRRVNLRGYFYWTLMDNFEWGEGLSKRFGLLDVDFSDRKRYRRMRPAARRFGEFAAANAVTPEGALNAAASA